VLLAQYLGHTLFVRGAYRSLPWAHLGALPLLLALCIWVARGHRTDNWRRRLGGWIGSVASAVATATLWLMIFAGSRLPSQARPALTVAPDFVLPDQDGNVVRLAQLRAVGPVVVVFHRGAFDRYALAALHDLRDVEARIAAAGGHIVAISGDPAEEGQVVRSRIGVSFPLLVDADLAVSRSFGVVEEGGRAARPATFVIDGSGRVRWLDFPTSLRDFTDVDEVARQVELAR
jgi:peroxiredoxin